MGIKPRFIFVLLALAALPFVSRAQEQRLHTVQPGNTLFSIAREYGSTVGAILSANPGTSENELSIGQTLVVPIPVSADEDRWVPLYHFHQVQSYESVFSISHKYGIQDSTLYWHNPVLEGKPLIKTGQWLRIPKSPEKWAGQTLPPFTFDPGKSTLRTEPELQQEKSSTSVSREDARGTQPLEAPKADTLSPATPDLERYTTYVVQEGDTPRKLANEWGMRSVREFFKYNPEARSNFAVGMVLLRPNAERDAERLKDTAATAAAVVDTLYIQALLPVMHRDYVDETKVGERSAVALEFYQGMLLAAQQYRDTTSSEVVLQLRDTQNHRDTLAGLFGNEDREADLYMGPLFAQRVQEVLRTVPPSRVASPLSKNQQLLGSGAWNTQVSESVQWSYLAQHLSQVAVLVLRDLCSDGESSRRDGW